MEGNGMVPILKKMKLYFVCTIIKIMETRILFFLQFLKIIT